MAASCITCIYVGTDLLWEGGYGKITMQLVDGLPSITDLRILAIPRILIQVSVLEISIKP